MAKNKIRLGKGLGALIPQSPENLSVSNEKQILMLDPRTIMKNPYQPRLSFDQQALNELKQSIVEKGLIQPLAVRKNDNNYELIAGERRLRSVLELGLDKIPVYLLEVNSKEDMLEIALIENVQREKLNVIELAKSFQQLVDDCNMTIESVAQKIGKERSTINNILRLLKLPKFTQDKLIKNKISMGHARALLGLADTSKINQLAEEVARKEISVRRVEQIIRLENDNMINIGQSKKLSKTNKNRTFIRQIENIIRQSLGTKVRIKDKKNGGTIELEYYSDDDLHRLKERFEELN